MNRLELKRGGNTAVRKGGGLNRGRRAVRKSGELNRGKSYDDIVGVTTDQLWTNLRRFNLTVGSNLTVPSSLFTN